jgi:hypothetical protein
LDPKKKKKKGTRNEKRKTLYIAEQSCEISLVFGYARVIVIAPFPCFLFWLLLQCTIQIYTVSGPRPNKVARHILVVLVVEANMNSKKKERRVEAVQKEESFFFLIHPFLLFILFRPFPLLSSFSSLLHPFILSFWDPVLHV